MRKKVVIRDTTKKNLIPVIQELELKLISIFKSVNNTLLICDGNMAINF